jgi:hypothetical protein
MGGAAIMRYVKFNTDKELKKAAQGKKTKVHVGLLVYLAMKDYPAIQAAVGRAFSIE